MPVFIPPCLADQTALVCAKTRGWPGPYTYNLQSGTAAPEGVVTGYGPSSTYFRSSTSKWYNFGGVAGANTGWNIIN